jgi:hypothetical protein
VARADADRQAERGAGSALTPPASSATITLGVCLMKFA